MRPESFRYRVTTFDPGARLVFTHGLTPSPRAAAFRARIPAPSITDGFDVFVQLVIAAITTEPWPSSPRAPFIRTGTRFAAAPASFTKPASAARHAVRAVRSGTRSC